MLNGRPRQKPTANQGHRTRGIVDTPVESSYAAYFEPGLDNHPWRSIEVFHLKALGRSEVKSSIATRVCRSGRGTRRRAERTVADAFDSDGQFSCPGHHPHLRLIESKTCKPAK